MDDLVYRLRKRAEIRRQIPNRKSVQQGEPDRIADLLEEAADYIEKRGRSEQREWVGLTDVERKACWHDSLGFYRTIETASKEMERILKEKNT